MMALPAVAAPTGVRTNAMLPIPYRVQRLSKETHDTFTLELEPLNGGVTPAFEPGQFNMLYAFGAGEVPISISGDPAQSQTLIHTIRAVGTVTQAMRRVRRGDVLGVRGPFGAHWPTTEAEGKDIVMVTGGIGLAPLRPVIYHLVAHRRKYGKIALLYGARTAQDVLYAQELAHWRGEFDLQVEVTVDSAADDWRGNVGVVTSLLPRARFDPADTIALVCGPEVMMRFTLLELQKRHLGTEQIFVSLERNMQCGIGLCGHCQLGPLFICKDGPVFRYDRIQAVFGKREL
jgi:NAD(P)H-flavin reductase